MKKILVAACITAISLLLSACTQLPQASQHTTPTKKENKWAESDKRIFDYLETQGLYAPKNIHRHPYADLLSSALVNDITPQERKYMTEALDAFPKRWVLKDLSMVAGPDWLDDHHVAVSVRSYPGWVAKPNDQPRIISINLDTGKIKDSGYRGNLKCLNHKGDLMISLDLEPAKGIRLRDELNWYIGTWGGPLQEIHWRGDFIPRYLCRYAPYGDLIYGSDWQSLPIGANRIFPLLPEHGVLKESITLKNNSKGYKLELIKPDGTAIIKNIPMPIDDNFTYQPWDSGYFISELANKSSFTLYPSGEVLFHQPPRLIKFWHDSLLHQAYPIRTKLGVLWVLASFSKIWRKYGLYLETPKELIRIEQGEGGSAFVSPNGCRVLSFVERGNTNSKRRTGPLGYMLIDLCKTGAK